MCFYYLVMLARIVMVTRFHHEFYLDFLLVITYVSALRLKFLWITFVFSNVSLANVLSDVCVSEEGITEERFFYEWFPYGCVSNECFLHERFNCYIYLEEIYFLSTNFARVLIVMPFPNWSHLSWSVEHDGKFCLIYPLHSHSSAVFHELLSNQGQAFPLRIYFKSVMFRDYPAHEGKSTFFIYNSMLFLEGFLFFLVWLLKKSM